MVVVIGDICSVGPRTLIAAFTPFRNRDENVADYNGVHVSFSHSFFKGHFFAYLQVDSIELLAASFVRSHLMVSRGR